MVEVKVCSLLDSIPILLRTALTQRSSPFHDREDGQVMCQARERTQNESILIAEVDNPRSDTNIMSESPYSRVVLIYLPVSNTERHRVPDDDGSS